MHLTPAELFRIHALTDLCAGLGIVCDCFDCNSVRATREAIALRALIQEIMEEKNQ